MATCRAVAIAIIGIPIDSAAEQMGIRKAPLTSYAKEGRAASAYIKLWKEMNRVLKKDEFVNALGGY